MRLEESYKHLEKIENIGVVLRPQSPNLKEAYLKIERLFKENSINVLLEENSANMIDKSGINFDTLCKNIDFLISVGGDGTLIGVVRKSIGYNLPVLGINLGTLGFLTDIKLEELENFIEDLIKITTQ